MTLDVILPTAGARDSVRACLETLPVAMRGLDYRLTIFDNQASELDGTRDWLRSFAAQNTNIVLLESQETLSHGSSLDVLFRNVRSPYLITFHSDVVFHEPCFAEMLELVISNEASYCAQVYQDTFTKFKDGTWHLLLPNVRQIASVYATSFIRGHGLSWCSTRAQMPPPKPGAKRLPLWFLQHGPFAHGRLNIYGDTGWQMFAASKIFGRHGITTPDRIHKCYTHKFRSTRLFLGKHNIVPHAVLPAMPQQIAGDG